MRKTVSISIPCRNEVDNIIPLYQAITNIFQNELSKYVYVIQFIDNASEDGTQEKIKEICEKDKQVHAIFNVKNFGHVSGFHGFLQTEGDCTITIAADFQEPVELIPSMVHEWENGATIVCAIKKSSSESKIKFAIRTLYYRLLKCFSEYPIIEHFSGFGLYDKTFVDFLKSLEDPCPYMRGLVAEFGYGIREVYYEQPKRKAGKTKNNFFSLFDLAMRSFTTYTKVGPRIATIGGFLFSGLSFIAAFIYLVLKLIYWNRFPMGIAPIVIGVFLLGSIQLFFVGLLGEYILTMNERIKNRPLVIEKERLNMGVNKDE